jgi:hypothetical protein
MALLSKTELQFYGSRSATFRIWAEGDSYVGGAPDAATSFQAALRAQGYIVMSSAVGGSTMTDIRDRILANVRLIRQCDYIVVWDGSHNGYVDAASYTDLLETGLDAAGIPFIAIPAAVPYDYPSTTQPDAILAEYESRWPGSVYDWRDAIPTTNGRIDQDQMLFYQGEYDATHLSLDAYDLVAADVAELLA